MGKTRAVRLSDEDEKLIADFMHLNPAMDFSTLIRMALRQFVHDPHHAIRPIKLKEQSESLDRSKNLEN